jgi:hypothetical protein
MRRFELCTGVARSMPGTECLILRSGPEDRVSKDGDRAAR